MSEPRDSPGRLFPLREDCRGKSGANNREQKKALFYWARIARGQEGISRSPNDEIQSVSPGGFSLSLSLVFQPRALIHQRQVHLSAAKFSRWNNLFILEAFILNLAEISIVSK